jgi:hypothetical protein
MKKGLYNSNGSEIQEPLTKMTWEEKSHQEWTVYNQKNQSTKLTQKNKFFLVKKASWRVGMHKYKFGVKTQHFMKLHRKISRQQG